jgi:hypothetical protein
MKANDEVVRRHLVIERGVARIWHHCWGFFAARASPAKDQR